MWPVPLLERHPGFHCVDHAVGPGGELRPHRLEEEPCGVLVRALELRGIPRSPSAKYRNVGGPCTRCRFAIVEASASESGRGRSTRAPPISHRGSTAGRHYPGCGYRSSPGPN